MTTIAGAISTEKSDLESLSTKADIAEMVKAMTAAVTTDFSEAEREVGSMSKVEIKSTGTR